MRPAPRPLCKVFPLRFIVPSTSPGASYTHLVIFELAMLNTRNLDTQRAPLSPESFLADGDR